MIFISICFDSQVINRAWKILENEKTRKRCLEIVEEAKGMTEMMVSTTLPQLRLNHLIFINCSFRLLRSVRN